MIKNKQKWIIITITFTLLLIIYKEESKRFFWLDEITTLNIARAEYIVDTIREARNETQQPPLFYLFGRVLAIQSVDPIWLRSISLFFFLGTIFFFLNNLYSSLLSVSLLLFYIFYSPFTYYLISEFRPYSMSLFLFSWIFVTAFNYTKDNMYFYPKLSLLIICFSLALSLNIPLSLVLLILLILFYLYNQKSESLKLNLNSISLIFSFISLILIINFIKSEQSIMNEFNIESYLAALEKTVDIIFQNIVPTNGIFLYFIIFVLVISRFQKNTKNIYYLLFIFSIFAYSILFPTLILYNRIPWYSDRYSHLIYLLLPMLLMIFKKEMNVIYTTEKSILGNIVVFLFLISMSIYALKSKPIILDINGPRSLWASFPFQKKCNFSESSIFVLPDYVDRVAKYHLEISKLDNTKVYGLSQLKNQLKDSRFECVVIANSNNNLELNPYEKILLDSGFSEVVSMLPLQDWPQNLNRYSIFKKNP